MTFYLIFSVNFKTKLVSCLKELWLGQTQGKHPQAVGMVTSADTWSPSHLWLWRAQGHLHCGCVQLLCPAVHGHSGRGHQDHTTGHAEGRLFLRSCKRLIWFQVVWVTLGRTRYSLGESPSRLPAHAGKAEGIDRLTTGS